MDSRIYRIIGLTLLFVIIATIVFVFVKTLVFDQPINDQALKQALTAASVGVTLSCLIAWVLDLLQVIDLRPGWSKLLWTVLVTSILTSSALAYKQFATQTNGMTIACVRPVAVDESTGKLQDPVVIMNQERHKKGGIFAFIVTLRNLQTDQNGDYNVDLHYEFTDATGTSAFQQVSYAGNAKRLAADPARRKRLASYKQVMPDCVDEKMIEMLVRSSLQPTDQLSGTHELNVIVYDNAGKGFARTTLPVTIE